MKKINSLLATSLSISLTLSSISPLALAENTAPDFESFSKMSSADRLDEINKLEGEIKFAQEQLDKSQKITKGNKVVYRVSQAGKIVSVISAIGAFSYGVVKSFEGSKATQDLEKIIAEKTTQLEADRKLPLKNDEAGRIAEGERLKAVDNEIRALQAEKEKIENLYRLRTSHAENQRELKAAKAHLVDMNKQVEAGTVIESTVLEEQATKIKSLEEVVAKGKTEIKETQAAYVKAQKSRVLPALKDYAKEFTVLENYKNFQKPQTYLAIAVIAAIGFGISQSMSADDTAELSELEKERLQSSLDEMLMQLEIFHAINES